MKLFRSLIILPVALEAASSVQSMQIEQMSQMTATYTKNLETFSNQLSSMQGKTLTTEQSVALSNLSE